MAIPNLKIKTWGLQSKILILFVIALGSVITAAYFVRENERILHKTLTHIAEPEKRITLLHDILTIIPEAENNLRYFALTNSKVHYDIYEFLIDSVESNINKLTDNFQNDPSIRVQLDSITQLLEQRKQIIAAYIKIRKDREDFDFSKAVLNTVSKDSPDSISGGHKTRTTITTVYDTLAGDTVISKKQQAKGGIFNKIKKVFSKKDQGKEPAEVSAPVLRSTTRVQTDTSNIASDNKQKIKKLQVELSKIRQIDLHSYNDLREKELNMLHNSSLIIDQVTDIFQNLERSFISENESTSFKARLKASRSLLIIGVVSLVSLLLIMILIILIFISIRKSNRYRKELILANIQANELAKVKEEFLANMSHEMRTPLNAIIGFTDLLLDTHPEKEQSKYLSAVRQASKHLLETVNDILDLSKLVAGKFQIERRTFNLESLMKDTFAPFELMAHEKGLDFIIYCADEPDLQLSGDPLRLRQIMYNLLSNAIKFTNYGSITVRCDVQKEENVATLSISIEDTGIGIPSEINENIFEDFQQAETSSARTYGGSGLGLAISRRLARLHKGDITVKSTVGEGSVFTLIMKYEISDEKPLPAEEHEHPDAALVTEALKGKNILIIDDDSFSIMLSKIIGEKHAMNIQIAEDGYTAIDLIQNNDFHLIMTDLQMPGVTGRDIVRYVRNHPDPKTRNMPVLAFTANKLDPFDEKLIAEGFNEVLQKPFFEEELIERIYFYLGKTESTQDIASQKVVKEPEVIRKPKPKSKPGPSLGYSLEQVKLFSQGHADQERLIIESFINSASVSFREMKEALQSDKLADVKNVAHRSLTAYQLLKIDECVAILDELEKLNLNDPDTGHLQKLLAELEKKNSILFKELTKELKDLENKV